MIERIRARQMAHNDRWPAEHTAGGDDGEELGGNARRLLGRGSESRATARAHTAVRGLWLVRRTAKTSLAPLGNGDAPPAHKSTTTTNRFPANGNRGLGIAG